MSDELGSDFAGVLDVTPTLAVATGPRALADAILRRLTTPRGGHFEDPLYGYDLRAQIGAATPVSVIQQRVLEQVLAEEEVADARVSVTRSNGTLRVVIDVIVASGPFRLTVIPNELTIEHFLEAA